MMTHQNQAVTRSMSIRSVQQETEWHDWTWQNIYIFYRTTAVIQQESTVCCWSKLQSRVDPVTIH